MIPIVYNPSYNYYTLPYFPHPFTSDKARKIMEELYKKNDKLTIYSPNTTNNLISIKENLHLVHSPIYLSTINSNYVSKAIDFPGLLNIMPMEFIQSCILDPMLHQTSGTIFATEVALKEGYAINLGGGYHHARFNKGHGGCIYADIPLAIELKAKNKRVAIVDLDAHQGDGLQEYTYKTDNVYMMDMFNKNEFPFRPNDLAPVDLFGNKLKFPTFNSINMTDNKSQILEIPLDGGYLKQEIFGMTQIFGYNLEKLDPLCITEKVKNRKINDEVYLEKLREHLPKFLDNVKPEIVFYNAGSDIYQLDPWGCLDISKRGVYERDQYVWKEITSRKIPIVMTLSGGYSPDNVELVSESISRILNSHSS